MHFNTGMLLRKRFGDDKDKETFFRMWIFLTAHRSSYVEKLQESSRRETDMSVYTALEVMCQQESFQIHVVSNRGDGL